MDMHRFFLKAVSAGAQGIPFTSHEPVSPAEWEALFSLARIQNVFPLFYDTVSDCPALSSLEEAKRAAAHRAAARATVGQTMRTAAFQPLYQKLMEKGFHPILMKGLALRSLYPKPDQRPSSDEDLLLPDDEFSSCCALLEKEGLRCITPEADPDSAFELGFRSEDGFIYLELHRTPFAPDSDAMKLCNDWFVNTWNRGMDMTVEGFTFRTLNPGDHLLYLVLHAFKHFIHSGFGIRQVLDILLWAERYNTQLDWPALFRRWERVRCHNFAASLFRMGPAYLGFEDVTGGYIAAFPPERCDPEPLLVDLLDAGVFGGSSSSRKHSATITLEAVNAARTGRKGRLMKILFPSAGSLRGAFPWLGHHPWLLPVAWAIRLFRYTGEVIRSDSSSPTESLQLGKDRLALLRKYGILDK